MGYNLNELAFWLIVASLAANRITAVVHWETAGQPIRRIFGIRHIENKTELPAVMIPVYPDNLLGELFSCFRCLSFWVSIICCMIILIQPLILIPFAISSAAIIIEESMN